MLARGQHKGWAARRRTRRGNGKSCHFLLVELAGLSPTHASPEASASTSNTPGMISTMGAGPAHMRVEASMTVVRPALSGDFLMGSLQCDSQSITPPGALVGFPGCHQNAHLQNRVPVQLRLTEAGPRGARPLRPPSSGRRTGPGRDSTGRPPVLPGKHAVTACCVLKMSSFVGAVQALIARLGWA